MPQVFNKETGNWLNISNEAFNEMLNKSDWNPPDDKFQVRVYREGAGYILNKQGDHRLVPLTKKNAWRLIESGFSFLEPEHEFDVVAMQKARSISRFQTLGESIADTVTMGGYSATKNLITDPDGTSRAAQRIADEEHWIEAGAGVVTGIAATMVTGGPKPAAVGKLAKLANAGSKAMSVTPMGLTNRLGLSVESSVDKLLPQVLSSSGKMTAKYPLLNSVLGAAAQGGVEGAVVSSSQGFFEAVQNPNATAGDVVSQTIRGGLNGAAWGVGMSTPVGLVGGGIKKVVATARASKTAGLTRAVESAGELSELTQRGPAIRPQGDKLIANVQDVFKISEAESRYLVDAIENGTESVEGVGQRILDAEVVRNRELLRIQNMFDTFKDVGDQNKFISGVDDALRDGGDFILSEVTPIQTGNLLDKIEQIASKDYIQANTLHPAEVKATKYLLHEARMKIRALSLVEAAEEGTALGATKATEWTPGPGAISEEAVVEKVYNAKNKSGETVWMGGQIHTDKNVSWMSRFRGADNSVIFDELKKQVNIQKKLAKSSNKLADKFIEQVKGGKTPSPSKVSGQFQDAADVVEHRVDFLKRRLSGSSDYEHQKFLRMLSPEGKTGKLGGAKPEVVGQLTPIRYDLDALLDVHKKISQAKRYFQEVIDNAGSAEQKLLLPFADDLRALQTGEEYWGPTMSATLKAKNTQFHDYYESVNKFFNKRQTLDRVGIAHLTDEAREKLFLGLNTGNMGIVANWMSAHRKWASAMLEGTNATKLGILDDVMKQTDDAIYKAGTAAMFQKYVATTTSRLRDYQPFIARILVTRGMLGIAGGVTMASQGTDWKSSLALGLGITAAGMAFNAPWVTKSLEWFSRHPKSWKSLQAVKGMAKVGGKSAKIGVLQSDAVQQTPFSEDPQAAREKAKQRREKREEFFKKAGMQ